MSKLLFVVLFGAAISLSFDESSVKVGQTVPDFKAIDDQGNTWSLYDHLKSDYLVVYFYPAAFTGGCTAQACSYRDHMSELALMNASVVGISGDEPQNLGMFRKEHNLNFTLLSDQDGEIAKLFGVPLRDGGTIEREIDGTTFQLMRGVTTSRYTYVIDINRKLIYKNNNVNAANDSESVYEFIQTHNQRKSCR
jgi:peroxiredoxin Q/BCP